MQALLVLLWIVVALWAAACVRALVNFIRIPRLGGDPLPDPPPSLCVVVPARDEEAGIEEAVASHCGQAYPGLRVVVVEDRSTDRTPAILERLRGRFENLRVVAGEDPPAGWLGKQNALRLGLEASAGEFILMADADVVYAPGVHARAAGEMVRRGLDMLAIVPWLEGRGLEPLVLSMFPAVSLYAWPTHLSNVPAARRLHLVSPSGLLVRREALMAAGGLDRIKDKMLDDVAMARMMKAHRGRFRMVLAFGSVRHRMYRSLAACVEGFTKNCFDLFGSNVAVALGVHGGDLCMETAPAAVLALSAVLPVLGPLRLPALLAVAAGALLNAAACLWSRQPLWVALAFPLRPVLWSWILARSMGRRYRMGIVWRGRSYGRV